MSEEESFFEPSRKYKKISYELRMKLIKMVDQGQTYFQAGKKLCLSPSTAKMIVLKYNSQGKVFEKKKDKIKRIEDENILPEVVKQSQNSSKTQNLLSACAQQFQSPPPTQFLFPTVFYPFLWPTMPFVPQ